MEADLQTGSGKCALELIQLIKSKSEFDPIVVTQYRNNLNTECSKMTIENYSMHYARTCSRGMGVLGWLTAFFCRPFLNFISYRKLKKKINFNTISLIHSNTSAVDFGAYLYRKLHIPHIWHIREFIVFNHILSPIVYNLPRYIVQNSSYIITVSNLLKQFIQNKTHCSNIITIYDGVRNSLPHNYFRPTNKSNKLRIICIGNLTPLKGQDILLKAISLLPPAISNNISIDFFGSIADGFDKKLTAIIQEYSLEHIVSFKGFCNNIFSILRNYDIGIHPSLTEGFSRVTIEYMLAGLCVIGNGNTTIQEQIEDKKTGLLYNGSEIQSLANKISYCFYNKDKMKLLGQNARKIALEKYCIENNFHSILNVYQSIGNK